MTFIRVRRIASLSSVLVSLISVPARADLPGFLRMENSEVRTGNEALQKGDAKGALESYNRAARKLPDAAGVQLDRGLSLLKQGDYGKAREALLAATAPSATSELRADAYENLALSFYREADGLAGQEKHAEAQKLFREAVDAAKRSLHLRPQNPNAAWNLELAARRIREEEQKQKDQDKNEQDKQDKQDKNDQDKSDEQKHDDTNQNQDQKQDQKPSDPDQAKQDKPNHEDKKEPPKPKEPAKTADKPESKDPSQAKQAEPNKDQPGEQALPREATQALDSLEDGEENFERYRARQRASRERRAPDKDW